jgi:glutaminyl-peptide cyclotransferase
VITIFQRGAAFAGSLLFLFLVQTQAQTFDGERAYGYLVEQCNLGTREPNSAGHKKAKEYLEGFLKKQKGAFARDDFTYQNKTDNKALALTNFQLLFKGKGGKRRLFCAHWDTRPWADHDPDLTNRSRPIPGANDGASGVAVLMELCNLFSKKPPSSSVEIVLFDGEDIGKDRNNEWCQGSKRFASKADPKNYFYAVLLDMIGDKDLEIKREGNSQVNAPWLLDRIWAAAKEIRADAFTEKMGPGIYDDHIPLIEKGIPSADIIDFDYPAWHTLSDLPEKCSAQSLQTIGNVLVKLAYEE